MVEPVETSEIFK